MRTQLNGWREPYAGRLASTDLRGGKLERAYLSQQQRAKPYQPLT